MHVCTSHLKAFYSFILSDAGRHSGFNVHLLGTCFMPDVVPSPVFTRLVTGPQSGGGLSGHLGGSVCPVAHRHMSRRMGYYFNNRATAAHTFPTGLSLFCTKFHLEENIKKIGTANTLNADIESFLT